MFARVLRYSLWLSLCVPLAGGVVACGSKSEAKMANVKPGEMPIGGTWRGVYYSTLYGELHLEADGSSANGAWRTTAGDSFGELHGKIEGDLLKFEWVERKIGMVGADAERKGHGYFRYMPKKEGEAEEIVGEWGLGESDAGNEWKAVKQVRKEPNLASVKPDEIEGRTNVSNWDDEGGGSPESGSGSGSGSEGSGSEGSGSKKKDDEGGTSQGL
jgi:hypothetical protein